MVPTGPHQHGVTPTARAVVPIRFHVAHAAAGAPTAFPFYAAKASEGAEALPTVPRPTKTAVGRGANIPPQLWPKYMKASIATIHCFPPWGRERDLLPCRLIVPVNVSSPMHYGVLATPTFLKCKSGVLEGCARATSVSLMRPPRPRPNHPGDGSARAATVSHVPPWRHS